MLQNRKNKNSTGKINGYGCKNESRKSHDRFYCYFMLFYRTGHSGCVTDCHSFYSYFYSKNIILIVIIMTIIIVVMIMLLFLFSFFVSLFLKNTKGGRGSITNLIDVARKRKQWVRRESSVDYRRKRKKKKPEQMRESQHKNEYF